MLTLFRPVSHQSSSSIFKVVNENSDPLYTAFSSLVTPAFSHPEIPTALLSRALYSIILLVWNVIPHDAPSPPLAPPLWSAHFVQLALHNWATAAADRIDLAASLLLHTAQLNVLINISTMQSVVEQHLGRKRQSQVTVPSATANDSPLKSDLRALFGSSDGRITATWHASEILSLAHYHLSVEETRIRGDLQPAEISGQHNRPRSSIMHYPYSVGYATLTLWCAETLKTPDSQEAKKWLKFGLGLLAPANQECSHVGAVFASILKELL